MTQEPKIFPYIEHLLQGAEVVWKPLGEIASMYGGLTGKNKTDFEGGNASYITYKNIFDNIEVDFDKLEKVKISASEKQNKVRYGDVLFTGSSETAEDAGMSSAITTTIEEDIYLNSFSFGIRFNEDVELIPEFSKYLFRSHFMRAAISKTASGVTRFNISKERLKKLSIPLPPLSVQQEIVRILDKFTTLEAELEAELDCRKRQYDYYRNHLLSYEGNEVEWKTLGEVCKVLRGKRLTKRDLSASCKIPVFHGGIEPIGYYNESNRKANSTMLINVGASAGTVGFCNRDFWSSDGCFCFLHNNTIRQRFLYYVLQTMETTIKSKVRKAGIPTLDNKEVERLRIPLPPLEEQQRIVGILDKFDTLVNSISEGLPREIELRRKQYEYYREQLLSFPEYKVTA